MRWHLSLRLTLLLVSRLHKSMSDFASHHALKPLLASVTQLSMQEHVACTYVSSWSLTRVIHITYSRVPPWEAYVMIAEERVFFLFFSFFILPFCGLDNNVMISTLSQGKFTFTKNTLIYAPMNVGTQVQLTWHTLRHNTLFPSKPMYMHIGVTAPHVMQATNLQISPNILKLQ